jgi:hypothetical protein
MLRGRKTQSGNNSRAKNCLENQQLVFFFSLPHPSSSAFMLDILAIAVEEMVEGGQC